MAVNWFPLWLSLRVAALATLVSLALGLWIAYVLANRKYRGKELLDAVVTLPLVLPPTVLGYYLLVALGRTSPLGHLYEYLFGAPLRSEEHTSELQSLAYLVCRLLLEKKKNKQ